MSEIKRQWSRSIYIIIPWALIVFGYYKLPSPWGANGDYLTTAIFALLTFPLAGIAILAATYAGEGSKLYGLKPVYTKLPIVKKPEVHVHFRQKMMWTILALIIYMSLTNVFIYGLDKKNVIDVFESYRAILAGASGSLMHLGIGPIVTASIIMQLFVGAKIFNLDLGNDEDRAVYQGTQKLLVIIMIFVEAIPQVYGYLKPSDSFVDMLDKATGHGALLANTIIVAQLFAGSYLVFLLDEMVSKWGIGSGISLFIAAGVSQAIFTGTFNWVPVNPNEPLSVSNPPSGTIPKTIYLLKNSSAAEVRGGILERILFANPNPVIALIGTIIIFLVVAYAESTKIELPLAHERARGARGRYPIKLMYCSNIPVILTSALLANIAMWTLLFWSNPTLSKVPILGHNPWLGKYPTAEQAAEWGIRQNTPIGGLAYYVSRVNGLGSWLLPLINPNMYGSYVFYIHTYWQHLAHVVIYFAFMVGFSILFAKFWIETANMNARAVAEQIQRGGMQIPGFRRDPRVLEKILNRYIPPITIFSGAAVGALAATADLIGTVGNASGTGVLLTVGILIQFYEAMGREQLMEMHPVIRQFFETGGRRL